MTLVFDGTGGIFTRLGKVFGMGVDIRTHQADLETEVDDILDEYGDDREMCNALQQGLTGFIASSGSPIGILKQVAARTVIDMVAADNPQPDKSLRTALIELIRQMAANSESVDGTTVSGSTAAGAGNTGTGTVLHSFVDGEGNALVNVRAEDIRLVCTADAQVSGTAGQETFSVKGEATVPNTDKDWPDGSGINGTLAVASPSIDAGSGVNQNHLTNSDFEDFTANAPDSWTIDVGSAGTTVDDTTTAYRGSKALQFIGNGSQLTAISQDVSGILPQARYLLVFRVRDDGTGPAAGVLRVSLRSGAGAEVGSSAISVDLTAVGSTYAIQSKSFSTPLVLPTGLQVVVELTTALTNTRAVFIDDLALVRMQQFGGPGGPYLTIVPGGTAFVRDDEFTVAVTNNNEGGFVREFDRFFDMYRLGLFLPQDTGGTETIDDALIS